MPKARRYFEQGHCYHLTHRCHDRKFLLRFAKDRDAYRILLKECSREYGVPVLGYCLTSNHVHLLVMDNGPGCISRFMDALEGGFAQKFNGRKGRSGAYWSGRYHATAIERSAHLWSCLLYIELNMVRAGVIGHPGQWSWCSYGELAGAKKRYRVVDRDVFARVFGRDPNAKGFVESYRAMVDEKLGKGMLAREPEWSESLAVGSREYVDKVSALVENRRRLEAVESPCVGHEGWVLREERESYKA